MEEYVLGNNLRLIYKHTDSELSSICISINAGAGEEHEKYGVAHATEHMVYKGTKNRTEKQINEQLSNIFGFNNAMTNYPYVIYYGTLLKGDFENGIKLLSDVVVNPSFSEQGFKEEMDVIKEELKEWDEELEQFCEDKLFFNCFTNRRIKYPIIGTMDSLNAMTINDIKKFYDKYYSPESTSIAVISSLEFSKVKDIICEYFRSWKYNNEKQDNKYIEYEVPKLERFKDKREGIRTCRVEIVCPIDTLCEKEIRCLRIFNQYFGEGVNSILYDTLRTKNGLIYDVLTNIAHENYMKLYKITFNIAEENVNTAISLINSCIEKIYQLNNDIFEDKLGQWIKNFKLKRLFREEQSIVLAKELATYDSMFGNYNIYFEEVDKLNEITSEMVLETGKKVLRRVSIQIIN